MKVKMLAVLALVLLVSGASEGRILSKCELKSQLEAALGGNGPVTVTNGPGSVTRPGNVTVSGNLTVPGNVTVSGNLTVPGNVTVSGNRPTTVSANTTANLLIAQSKCCKGKRCQLITSNDTNVSQECFCLSFSRVFCGACVEVWHQPGHHHPSRLQTSSETPSDTSSQTTTTTQCKTRGKTRSSRRKTRSSRRKGKEIPCCGTQTTS